MEQRSRGRFRSTLYVISTTIMGLAIIILSLWLLFHIKAIDVVGNERIDSDELIYWIQKDDPLSVNSIYIWGKYQLFHAPIHEGLQDIKISLKSPQRIQVKVVEKQVVGFLSNEQAYIYLDQNGLVLAIEDEVKEGVPFLEGIVVLDATKYELVSVEDQAMLDNMITAIRVMREQTLSPDRMMIKENQLYLKFGDIYANLGSTGIDSKVVQIPPILQQLQNEEAMGTIHLELFQKPGDVVRFENGVIPE